VELAEELGVLAGGQSSYRPGVWQMPMLALTASGSVATSMPSMAARPTLER
jgi:hypothetical protein